MIPALAARGVRSSIVTLVDDDGALEDRLSTLDVQRVSLTLHSPAGKVVALREIVRAGKPDLLHTTLWQSTLTGRLTGRLTGTPVVTTLANSDYGPEHRANSAYGSWSVRALHTTDLATARLTRRFHAISAEVARTMGRRLQIPADRLQVVYRGRDPGRLGSPTPARRQRVRAELSVGLATPVVLSVGRLDRQKGIETTVRAFRLVRDRFSDAVLLIAGRPGNASGAVESAMSGLPGVRVLGHRTDIADLMCAADVLSFPSRWEGLGGTLVEAMALRLPIVASAIAPIAETLGAVGWPLVPPDDPAALATELIATLSGGAGVTARKDAGHARFQSAFTLDAAADGMLDFYRQALAGAPAMPRIGAPCS
jgi:glycosyltransferase involved in cell wall biosynthesis